MKFRTLPLLVLPLILSCAFVCRAPAGETAQEIPLYSNGKGDSGWIELDRSAGRMRATPYLRLSGETVLGAVETAGRAGEDRVCDAAESPNPETTARSDRKTADTEGLASLLSGPGGVSLGAVLDLARQASDSARDAFREVRAGHGPPPRQADAR